MNREKREKSKINRRRERKGKRGVLLKDKETVGDRVEESVEEQEQEGACVNHGFTSSGKR